MKMSQILKDTTVPQLYGALIAFDEYTKEFKGKCALGVLACESGNPDLKLSVDNMGAPWEDIIKAYGVDPQEGFPTITCNRDYEEGLHGWDFEYGMDLSLIIIRLNDSWKLSFEEIGEFLEVTFDL